MTNVRKFLPENRLAKAMEDPNGLLVGHALQKASANLDGVRDVLLAALDKKLDQLGGLAAAATVSNTAEDAAVVYRQAREILADAGAFGVKDVSRAAHSLCELMASGRTGARLWSGVAVHVEAIGALRKPAAASARASRDAMLAGLETISRAAPP